MIDWIDPRVDWIHSLGILRVSGDEATRTTGSTFRGYITTGTWSEGDSSGEGNVVVLVRSNDSTDWEFTRRCLHTYRGSPDVGLLLVVSEERLIVDGLVGHTQLNSFFLVGWCRRALK